MTFFRFNPLGAALHTIALLIAVAGVAGAVFVSDVLEWGRVAGALLCIGPAECLALPFVLFVSFGLHQHWIHQYRVKR